jgi:type II secretion system protein G
MRTRKRRAAFTLIELLIVVGIIAILAMIALPNFLEAQTRAKVSRTKSDMRTIVTALEVYAVDHNHYPPNYDAGDYVSPPPVTEYLTYACLTTPQAYIASVPLDPFRPGIDEPSRARYFDYIGADTVPTNSIYDEGMKSYWASSGMRWVITSSGPDLTDSRLGFHLDQPAPYVYDPTNGTVSSGDFSRTNHGLVPTT